VRYWWRHPRICDECRPELACVFLGVHLVVSQTFRPSNGSGSFTQKLARARILLLYGS